MAQVLDNLEIAAHYASQSIGLSIEPIDLCGLAEIGLLPEIPAVGTAPAVLRPAELDRFAGQITSAPGEGDLFSGLQALVGDRERSQTWAGGIDSGAADGKLTFVRLGRAAGLSFPVARTVMGTLQVFLTALRGYGLDRNMLNSDQRCTGEHLVPVTLGEGVTFWGSGTEDAATVQRLWRSAVSADAALSPADVLTVPSLYGNKGRMLSFLTGIVRNHVPAGGVVCDLMSGTGVVSQALGTDFDIFANDANRYATILTGWRKSRVTRQQVDAIRDQLEKPFLDNLRPMEQLFSSSLDQERHFLHTASSLDALANYRDYCITSPAYYSDGQQQPRDNGDSAIWNLIDKHRRLESAQPHCMLAAYYGNAYFGLRQAITLDSIRSAVDKLDAPGLKEVALAALVMTAVSCASWAHFAQPPKLHSSRQMRKVIERRVKNAADEFSLILELLAAPRSTVRLRDVWNSDWRGALARFREVSSEYPSGARAIYVDPPYGKMQYSRYYHVLNTLVDYNYPVCSGVGRCPPMGQRFSSRFEYQPGAAANEFGELVGACGDAGFTLVLSYSDQGFVAVRKLVDLIESHYRRVLMYAVKSRHHFQGRSERLGRDQVREYVIVGTNG